MSGRYTIFNHRPAKCIAAGLCCCALWSSAAPAAEPGVYPQTPYAPPALAAGDHGDLPLASRQTPVVTAPRDTHVMPVAAQADSGITFLEDYQRDEQVVGAACSDGSCDTCHGDSFTGGYPDDWMWGCGGSPFRTGPGMCDTWKVGPVWDVSVDGMTLFRDEADLAALEAMAIADGAPDDPLTRETQFGYGGGARIWVMGKLPRWEKYQVQFGYEGTEEWNAALLFPETTVGVDTDGVAGDEYEYDENRSLHYRSSMHSAEFNFYRRTVRTIRPFWGIRYLRFTDEITDTTDQDAPFPPPVAGPPDPVTDAVTLEDSTEFFDIKNNLVGFQLGLREDLWHLNRRVTFQGFVNAGVYYNRIQFAQGSLDTTTTFIPDDGTTADANEAQSLSSSTAVVSSSEPSDVAYLAEASITAICRLNRCVALRGGYQLFWVDGLALAEDAYLDRPLGRHDFLMQGWHVGVEYRR